MSDIPVLKESLIDKIERSLIEMVNLKTTTIVGTEQKGRAISTTRDIFQGDIKTIIHDDFIADESLKPIFDFHREREDMSVEIIDGNIKALKSLLELAKDLTA